MRITLGQVNGPLRELILPHFRTIIELSKSLLSSSWELISRDPESIAWPCWPEWRTFRCAYIEHILLSKKEWNANPRVKGLVGFQNPK